MSNLFDRFFGVEGRDGFPGGASCEGVKLIEGDEGMRVVVDAEGFRAGDLAVTLQEKWLLIRGSKGRGLGDTARCGGDATEVFVRRIELRGRFEIDKVEAWFRDGVLEVVLPFARGHRFPMRIRVD
jgi:HSP20 family molecular chaperone IbpA